jgi:hypothetical protein
MGGELLERSSPPYPPSRTFDGEKLRFSRRKRKGSTKNKPFPFDEGKAWRSILEHILPETEFRADQSF